MAKKYSIKSKRTLPNFELKAKVIGNGCCALMKKRSLTNWKLSQAEGDFIRNGVVPDNLDKLVSYSESIDNKLSAYSELEIAESVKVNNASYKRTLRLKDRIEHMLNKDNCIFLTLTFRDDVLNSTSVETRKKYIQRFLKENCVDYIANIDYGRKNEREHYHAVVIANDNKIDGSLYSYGAINFERVHAFENEETYENSSKRLSKYVNKLTNHAIKDTVKQNRIIYSRNTKQLSDIDILKSVFGESLVVI